MAMGRISNGVGSGGRHDPGRDHIVDTKPRELDAGDAIEMSR